MSSKTRKPMQTVGRAPARWSPLAALALLLVAVSLVLAGQPRARASNIYPASLPGSIDVTFQGTTDNYLSTIHERSTIHVTWTGTLTRVGDTNYLFSPSNKVGVGVMSMTGDWDDLESMGDYLVHRWGQYYYDDASHPHPSERDQLTVHVDDTGDHGNTHMSWTAGSYGVAMREDSRGGGPQLESSGYNSFSMSDAGLGNGTYTYNNGQLKVDFNDSVARSYDWGTESWSITGHFSRDIAALNLETYDANPDYADGVTLPIQNSGDTAQLATEDWKNAARSVDTVAADGVSLLLIRTHLLSSQNGPVHYDLQAGSGDGPLGSLWQVNDATLTDSTQAGGARDHLDAPGGDDGPMELTVTPTRINDEQWAFALYRPPRNFDNAGAGTSGPRERTIKLHASIPPASSGEGTTEAQDEITIVRPLVLLMHGTWDSEGTWDNSTDPQSGAVTAGFPLYVQGSKAADGYPRPKGGGPQFFVDRLTFADVKHAAGPVLENAQHVLEQIPRKLRDWRETIGAAGTQADVVTHSYGGLTMRYVTQQQASGPLARGDGHSFRRGENWGHGCIHKLITVGCTHRGSALANHMALANKNSGGLINTLLRAKGQDLDAGGAEDQFVLSNAIRALGQTRVPGHAIVGSGSLDHSGGALPFEVIPFVTAWGFDSAKGPYRRAGALRNGATWDFAALRRLSNYIFNLNINQGSDSLGDPDYDLTVATVSARGVMPSGAYSTNGDLKLAPGMLTHLNQTKSPAVSDRVTQLLMEPVNGGRFAYFPPPAQAPLSSAEKQLSDPKRFDPGWLRITPITPRLGLYKSAAAPATHPVLTTDASGATSPGAVLHVTVSWPQKTVSQAMVVWADPSSRGGIGFLSAGQSSLPLRVPAVDPGTFGIAALITSTDGVTDVATTSLDVADANPYASIVTDPTALTIQSTDSVPLNVYGRTNAGQLRNVTRSSRTHVTSTDPNVVTVTADGYLQPRNFGSTTVQVAVDNGGSTTVPVTVQGAPVGVQAVLSGKPPVLSLRSKALAGFAFLSSSGFDARTLLPQTLLINGVRPAQFKVLDVNKDKKPDLVVYLPPASIPGARPGAVPVTLLGAAANGGLFGGKLTVTAR